MKKNKYTFLEWVFDRVGFGKFILFFYVFLLLIAITAKCNLTNEKIQNEIKVCEYTCDSPSKQRIFHTHFYKGATCSKTITEQIKENK